MRKLLFLTATPIPIIGTTVPKVYSLSQLRAEMNMGPKHRTLTLVQLMSEIHKLFKETET